MRHSFCLIALFICGVLHVCAQNPADSIAFLMDKGECIICGDSDAKDCIQRHTEAIAHAIDKYARLYNLTDFSFNYDVIEMKQVGAREIVVLRIGKGTDVQGTRKEMSESTGRQSGAVSYRYIVDLCIKSAGTSVIYQYQYEHEDSSGSKTSKCLLCKTEFNDNDEK